MWLLGVVVRRYIDFLILLIPTPLVSVLFAAASLLFVHFVKCFLFLYLIISFFLFIYILLIWSISEIMEYLESFRNCIEMKEATILLARTI